MNHEGLIIGHADHDGINEPLASFANVELPPATEPWIKCPVHNTSFSGCHLSQDPEASERCQNWHKANAAICELIHRTLPRELAELRRERSARAQAA